MCESDPRAQARMRAICSQDILFWIDLFAVTKDPRKPYDILPFICYDFQRETILEVQAAIREGRDILIDKSRDMGISWIILYVFTWFWIFEPGSDFRVGSRKEEYVDKLGDIDTLLEKVRLNLNRQPIWMLPKGYDQVQHAGFMRITNPENSNAIIGESANPHFGSGGRRKAVLLDEYAKWEDKIADAAWTATADVTRCRIVVSTPVGSGNKFAILAGGTKEKISKKSLHWTLHPEKAKGAYYLVNGDKVLIESSQRAYEMWLNMGRPTGVIRSPWYDAEALRRSESDLAQEVDIDYLRSGRPFFSQSALASQRAWQYKERKFPTDPIPYGTYIKAKLIDIDNKIEVRDDAAGWLRINELPKEGYQYVVAGDTSEGLAKGDEAFGVIREKITRNVVACSNGLYPPDDWTIKLQRVAKYYNNADLVPENNNHGYSVCSDLKKMDCKLYWTKNDKGEATKAGFTTTPKSRPEMLDQLEEEVRKNVFELRDEVLINQFKTFVNNEKNGRPEADGNFLDDGVLACAIAGAVIKEIPFKAKATSNTRKAKAVEDAKRPMFSYAK